MVRAHFVGARGSTPAPGEGFVRYGGYTSCVALAHDGDAAPTLVLDAGSEPHVIVAAESLVLEL